MSRNVKYNAGASVLVGVVILGLLVLMTALGRKVARWDGYADSLPFLGLFVLFIVGHVISLFNSSKRRR